MEREKLIELVSKAQCGDSTAMEALFSAFYNDVYYFALKTVKDSDTACDITQEAFLEIIRTIGNLNEPAAFAIWMKQITYHQCTRYFKKKKEVQVDEDEDGNSIFDTLADESEDSIPSEVYEKEEFRNTILDMINDLTEEQRSAVMMYYYDELSVGQIAQIQGVSDGTVKSRLNYARKAMKKSVESYEKKHNVKLHSFSFLPLFMLFFGKEFMPAAKAAELQTVVSSAAAAAGTGAAAAGGTAAAAAVKGAAAGTGFATKIAALPIVTKIIAGVVAAAVAVGGGAALIGSTAKNKGHECKDSDKNCICDECSAGVHFINGKRYFGQVEHDAFCDNCGTSLGFYDDNMDGSCDVCSEAPCGDFHHDGHLLNADGICEWCGVDIEASLHGDPDMDGWCDHCGEAMCLLELAVHLDENRDCFCDLCTLEEHLHEEDACELCAAEFAPTTAPAAPTASLVTGSDSAVLTIDPVEHADGYRVYLNGVLMAETTETTYTIGSNEVNVGMNEVCVTAWNACGESEASDVMTTGKLADPSFTIDGTTKITFPWGDVENAQGYIIYGDDGEYLATIEAGEEFDFVDIYTEDGFYFPQIQACGDGWMSSEKCGIPVGVGGGAPIGYFEEGEE